VSDSRPASDRKDHRVKWLRQAWQVTVATGSILRQLGSGMNRFEKFVMLMLGLVLAGMTACSETRSSHRITYVVETPEGERQGSHVIETWRAPGGGTTGRFSSGFRGQAAFIDLGQDKNLVALLTHGLTGQDVDRHRGLANEVYRDELARLCAGRDTSSGCEVLDFSRFRFPPRVLPLHLIPTLVTFRDLNNPASAQVMRPQGLGAFGPGFALKEVRLEMVSAGIWPFNLLPIPFPQALFGTPITKGIEKRLPMLVTHRDKLRNQRTAPSDPYTAQFHQYVRE
jgi:hypothetical protein